MKRIIDIISQGETITSEFKECKNTFPKSAFETICAFLNRFGGDLLLGVADNGTIIGVNPEALSQIKKDFVTSINNPQKISPTIYLSIDDYEIDNKIVLHIFVPESSQVHQCSGKIYDRNEDGDFDITKSTVLIANLYIRKQKTYTENTVFPFVTTDDLRTDLINRCRLMATNRQPHHIWESLSNEALLKSVGLFQKDMQTGKSGYTMACILLFGKDETIMSAIPHHRTDAILRRIKWNDMTIEMISDVT